MLLCALLEISLIDRTINDVRIDMILFCCRNVSRIGQHRIDQRIFQTHAARLERQEGDAAANYAAYNRNRILDGFGKYLFREIDAKPFERSLQEWIECAFHERCIK